MLCFPCFMSLKAHNFVLFYVEAKLVNFLVLLKKYFHSICYYSAETLHVK